MRSATRATVFTFGAITAMAGLEHGIGEVLQGNVAPDGIVIESWEGSELFGILAGEPAMTVVPNLLASGVLTILSALAFLLWATLFVQRKHGGLVLILLSVVMLLVGGGFGPPILGITLGVAATRIGAPLTWWRAHFSAGCGTFSPGSGHGLWLPVLSPGCCCSPARSFWCTSSVRAAKALIYPLWLFPPLGCFC